MFSLGTQCAWDEGLWGSGVPGGGRPLVPASCPRIKDTDQKTPCTRAMAGNPDAGHWGASGHLGTSIHWDSPRAPSTTALSRLLTPSFPTRGSVAASSDSDSEKSREQLRASPSESWSPQESHPARPTDRMQGQAGCARAQPLAAQASAARSQNLGFPSSPGSFLLNAFSQVSTSTTTMRSPMTMRMRCYYVSVLYRRRTMFQFGFLPSFYVLAFCWLLSLSNVTVNMFSSQWIACHFLMLYLIA